jgi:tRNA (guanine37-N1)-methyltransferase
MRIDVATLFPDLFGPVLRTSILGLAEERGAVSYHVHDVRAWTQDKHRKVDDRPFGGGPGMVMMCQPLFDCVEAVEAMDERPARRVLLTPQGRRLDQELVETLAAEPRLLLMSGHYEGIDERVVDALDPLEVSIGDYVLSGGELPALVLIDAVVRLQPGALGHADSADVESFAVAPPPPVPPTRRTPDDGLAGRRLLDCPHYTRPRVWRDRAVPEVLLSGDHGAIATWRRTQMVARTQSRRPDLLAG